MKKALLFLTLLSTMIVFMAFVTNKSNDPWPVPAKYLNMVNPIKADAASIATGKSIYNQHCKSCHGTKGKGDGSKAAQLDTECGDFTTNDFKKQADGALFYKTFEGRKDMPSFKKKVPDTDEMWALINYMRTFK